MKHLFICLAAFCLSAITSSAQTIPNNSFESWDPYALGEYPTQWKTSDSVSAALGGGNNVFKGTDSNSGTFSLHLKSTLTTIGIKGPGMATNGNIAFTGGQFVFSGGSPFTVRSEFLTLNYKYIPTMTNDAGIVQAYLFKNNGTSRDTIAKAIKFYTGNTSTYTADQIPFVYNNFVDQPDSILIIMQSSKNINDPDLGVGTEFIIDDMGVTGTVSINDPSVVASFNVYPQPAGERLSIDLQLKNNEKINIEVFDLTGKLVLSSALNEGNSVLDVSSLRSGRYAVSLVNSSGKKVYGTTLSVQH